jgi:branched-chain amino acid transport system permease protein
MKLNARQLIVAVVLLAVLAGLAIIPSLKNLYITVLSITILSFVILTVSWVIFSGPTGYISLAPAAFFGMGMYTAAVFGKQMHFSLVILLAAAICFVFALLVGAVTLRLKGIYFAIFTFGLVFLIQQLLTWAETTFTHTRGRFVVVIDNGTIYYHMLGIFIVLMIAAFFLQRSKFGMALQAIGQDEDAASHAGVNVTPIKIIAFAGSSIFMAAAGAALAARQTYIDPGSAFSINYSFFPVLMAIFGGMNNLYGPVIGAAAFAYLEDYLTTNFPNYYMLVFGLTMVIVIAFLPDGLFGLLQRIWQRGAERRNADT